MTGIGPCTELIYILLPEIVIHRRLCPHPAAWKHPVSCVDWKTINAWLLNMAARGLQKLQKQLSHQSTHSQETECAICLEMILDSSTKLEGEDSIFCEGECQMWLHRKCVGLPDPAFKSLIKSSKPFRCFQCSLLGHSNEIQDLCAWIDHL